MNFSLHKTGSTFCRWSYIHKLMFCYLKQCFYNNWFEEESRDTWKDDEVISRLPFSIEYLREIIEYHALCILWIILFIRNTVMMMSLPSFASDPRDPFFPLTNTLCTKYSNIHSVLFKAFLVISVDLVCVSRDSFVTVCKNMSACSFACICYLYAVATFSFLVNYDERVIWHYMHR